MKTLLLFSTLIILCTACNKEFTKMYCDKKKSRVTLVPKKNHLSYLNTKRERTLKLVVDSIASYAGKLQIDHTRKAQVDNVIDSLNQINVFYNQIANAYYIGLLADYCNPETVKRYFDAIDSIKKDMKELELLKLQVNKIVSSNGIGGNNINDIIAAVDHYLVTRK